MSEFPTGDRVEFPIRGGGIRKETSTAGPGTKQDSGMGLAGNQRVSPHLTDIVNHLPYSPAGGAPVHVNEFTAGHRWTEADGKLHAGSGPGNLGW